MKPVPLLLAAGCGLLFACTSNVEKESPKRTLWDGVYSLEQTERGAKIYAEHCITCHAANMRGGAGARSIIGIEFQFRWKDKSMAELFDTVRTKMPPGNPGQLSEQQYIDVLSTILAANGFPTGADRELTTNTEALKELLISWEKP